jgi:PAS domain S-box-containing protein
MAFLDRRLISRRREDHERMRLFELSLDLLAVVGTDGVIRQANASWQRLLGWPVEELAGMAFLELLPADAQPAAAVAFDALRRGGPQKTFEHQFSDYAGGSRWVEWNATPDLENEAIYIAARDIMGRKLAEAESARLTAIVASSNDAIVSASLAGVIESWNPAAEHIFGYSAAEVMGRPLTMLVPRMSTDRTQQMLGEVSLGHLLTNMEVERRRKDGALIRVALTLSPVRNPEGAVIATSIIARLLGEGTG